jgi:squalene-hopene/tetraprenyl-beta-curcumene cyclase
MSSPVVSERPIAARLAALRPRASARIRLSEGLWARELSSCLPATAAAVSALVVAEQHIDDAPQVGPPLNDSWAPGSLFRGEFTQFVVQNLRWLAERQNDDGGWGETAGARSTLASTMLVEAAFHLTGVPAKAVGLLERAAEFVRRSGGVKEFGRGYEGDDLFAASVLTNYALAGLAPWRSVPSLARDQARLLMSRGSESAGAEAAAEAALVLSLGLVRFQHAKTFNPLLRWAARAARPRALAALAKLQTDSGGFLDSVPHTSFIVMSLAGARLHDHAIVRRGVEFLLCAMHPEGGWPTRVASVSIAGPPIPR